MKEKIGKTGKLFNIDNLVDENEYHNIYNMVNNKYKSILKKLGRKIMFRNIVTVLFAIIFIASCLYSKLYSENSQLIIGLVIVTGSILILMMIIIDRDKSNEMLKLLYNS